MRIFYENHNRCPNRCLPEVTKVMNKNQQTINWFNEHLKIRDYMNAMRDIQNYQLSKNLADYVRE